jgi:arylsulfatase A-like enzyme
MIDRPNILIFMTDHQRGDTVLPEHPCITPNLDKLMAVSLFSPPEAKKHAASRPHY